MAAVAKRYIKVRFPTTGKKRSCAMNPMFLVILVHVEGFPFSLGFTTATVTASIIRAALAL